MWKMSVQINSLSRKVLNTLRKMQEKQLPYHFSPHLTKHSTNLLGEGFPGSQSGESEQGSQEDPPAESLYWPCSPYSLIRKCCFCRSQITFFTSSFAAFQLIPSRPMHPHPCRWSRNRKSPSGSRGGSGVCADFTCSRKN